MFVVALVEAMRGGERAGCEWRDFYIAVLTGSEGRVRWILTRCLSFAEGAGKRCLINFFKG